MNYTVLLLRPDYCANHWNGEDTYLAHVTADDVVQAVGAAQWEVFECDFGADEDMQERVADGAIGSSHYEVLAVFEGHLNDLSGELP